MLSEHYFKNTHTHTQHSCYSARNAAGGARRVNSCLGWEIHRGGKKSIYRLAQANLLLKHCKMGAEPLLPNVSSSSGIALLLRRSLWLWSASPSVPSTTANTGLWLVPGCCSGDAAGAYEYWFAVSLGNHLQHVQAMLDLCQHFPFIQLLSGADKT